MELRSGKRTGAASVDGSVMEAPRRKRARKVIAPVNVNEPVHVALVLNSLPDEMLVHIFGHVDSISRKRIERVCWRWMHLLRDTTSLRDNILVHLSLPPFDFYNGRTRPSYLPDPRYHPGSRSLKNKPLLSDVLNLLLKANTSARLIHITETPYDDPCPVRYVDKHRGIPSEYLYIGALERVIQCLSHHARTRQMPVHVIFDKVTMSFEGIKQHVLEGYCDETFPVIVEFREVLVADISLESFVEVESYRVDRPLPTARHLTASVPFGEDTDANRIAFMELLNQNEPCLTTDEEQEFRSHMETIDGVDSATSELIRAVTRMTGITMTCEQLISGSVMTPFVKCLVLAAENLLAFLDLGFHDSDNDDS